MSSSQANSEQFYYIIAALIIDGLLISANIIELALLIKKWNRLDRIEHILCSLSISDLFAGIFAFSQDAKQLKEMLVNCGTDVNDIEALIFDCLFFFSVFSTNFHVCAIAVERLVAVMLPLKYGLFETSKCKMFTICFVWTLGFTLAPIVAFVFHTGMKIAGYVLLTISTTVFISYFLLVIALILRERRLRELMPHEIKKGRRDRNTTYFCLILGFSFLACVLPATLGLIENSMYHPIANLLVTINHLINPLVYFAKSVTEYRRRKESISNSRLLSRTLSRSVSSRNY